MSVESQIAVLLRELENQKDRLVSEVIDLQEKLSNCNIMAAALNGYITELEEENKGLKASNAANAHLSQEVLNLRRENQNLLRRISELRNSSTFKLQQENEALKKRVEVAEELLLNDPPANNTEEKRTAHFESDKRFEAMIRRVS